MNDFELTRYLRRELDEMEFCEKFQELWRDDFTREELVGLYKRGIEYCVEHDWPDNGFIKENFDKELLRKCKVFVDDDFGNIDGSTGVYVINGASSGELTFDAFDTATIYIRQASDIVINAKVLSRVFIDLYDNASAVIKQSDNASVFVYKRSKGAKLVTEGKVTIRS